MNIFEITIQRIADGRRPVVVEYQRTGQLPVRNVGELMLDEVQLLEQVTALDYGRTLGKALFRDDVRRALDRALSRTEDHLHVLLFVEDDELTTLGWQRLCAPIDGEWSLLCLNQRTPFSLYLPSVTDRRFPPIGRLDLRVLIIAASPENLGKYQLEEFDVAAAVADIRNALGDIPHAVLADSAAVPDAIGPPTLDALAEQITTEAVTILHFVCHGSYMRDSSETVIYLADDENQAQPVPASQLIERLKMLHGVRGLPRFTFLSTCESAAPEAEGALGGLGQRLVRDLGMPAVVAMTEKVSIKTANALTAVFYPRLREHGQPDLALVEASAGLAGRYDITVPALYSRLGGQPLFDDSLDRELTAVEIDHGLERLGELLPVRAPVFVGRYEERARTLQGLLEVAPEALSKEASKERKQALGTINSLCEEVLDLSFNALALGQDPPPYDSHCPFQGMSAFTYESRQFFFGREQLIGRLRQRLAEHPFLAVLGPSGSGKSSLVLAGLIPALKQQHEVLSWSIITPGSDPLARINQARNQQLLVVDQFEELFTLATDDAERKAFIERLIEVAEQQLVVITMRADFWGECASYPVLKEEMQAHQELIAPMTTAELRSSMEQQAGTVGLRFEADLANTILDDVAGEPGAMPLLQHALLELWKRRLGRWMQAEEYRTLGGVREAIARTADHVYDKAIPEEQKRMQDIFLRLTRLDEDGVGDERRDTRRRVSMAELVPAGADSEATRDLVRRLADARLVVTSVAEQSGEDAGGSSEEESKRRLLQLAEVEVAHEALIRYWPRLQTWLDEDRDAQRLLQALSHDAQEWNHAGRDESLLPRWNTKLEETQFLARRGDLVLSSIEQDYLDAAIDLRDGEEAEKERRQQEKLEAAESLAEQQRLRAEAEKRSTSRLRVFLAGAVMLAAIAFVAGWFAIQNANRANEQAAIAEANAKMEAVARTEAEQAKIEAEAAVQREAEQKVIAQTNAEKEAAARAEAEQEKERADQQAAIAEANVAREAEARADAETAQRTAENAAEQETIARNEAEAAAELAKSQAKAGEALFELAQNNGGGSILYALAATYQADVYPASVWRGLRRSLDDAPIRLVLAGHEDKIWSAAWSPDGKRVLTGSGDNVAYVWDSENGKNLLSLEGHTNQIRTVAWSPDGRSVLTGSMDGTARVWNSKNGESLHVLKGHTATILSVAWSPDGKNVLTGSWDGTARVWNGENGESLHVLKGHTASVLSVAWSPDSKNVLTGSRDGTTRVWNAETGQSLRVLEGHIGPVQSVAWSHDGKRVLTGSEDYTARVWDTENDQNLNILQGHTNSVLSVAWSPDDKSVLTGSRDGTARVWNTENDQSPLTLEGHTSSILSVMWSPDGKRVLTGSGDGLARIWDLETSQILQTLKGHTDEVLGSAWSSDGKRVLTWGTDGTVRLWDSKMEESQRTLENNTPWVLSVAWSSDGRRALTGGSDGLAKIWNAESGQDLRTLEGHNEWVWSVAWSPDGSKALTGSGDGTARVWNTENGTSLHMLKRHTSRVWSVAWSPDGSKALTGSRDGTARVWDVESGQSLQTLKGHTDSVRSVTWSPDGKNVLTGSEDGTARVWDAENGQSLYVLEGHIAPVWSVAWSPDGKNALTGGKDGTARVWDVKSGKSLQILKGHTKWVWSVAWSPDGKNVLTGSEDGTARVWDAENGQSLYVLEGHIEQVWSVAWSPSGKLALTGSRDGTARVWIMEPKPLVARLTERVCNIMGDDEIRQEIPEWRDCEVELEAVAEDLAEYKRLMGKD